MGDDHFVTYDDAHYGKDNSRLLPKIERLFRNKDVFPLLSQIFSAVVPAAAYHVEVNPLVSQDGALGGIFSQPAKRLDDASWQSLLLDKRWADVDEAVRKDIGLTSRPQHLY